MSKNDDALRCADDIHSVVPSCSPRAAAHIRRLVAENEALQADVDHKDAFATQLGRDLMTAQRENEAQAKKIGAYKLQISAYKLLEQSQTEQLSHHRAQADKYREAIATLQSERDANARLTEENEARSALLRQAVEAMEKLGTFDVRPSGIWWHFFPSSTGDYVNLREFRENAAPTIAAIRQHLEGKA